MCVEAKTTVGPFHKTEIYMVYRGFAHKWHERFAMLAELPRLLDDRQHLIVRDWAKRYGDRFRIRVGNQNFVFFTDPNAIKASFELGEDKLDAGSARRRFIGFLPKRSLLLSSGSDRQKLRMSVGKAIAQAGDLSRVSRQVFDICESLAKGKPENLTEAIDNFFLKVISEFLVGKDDKRFCEKISNTSKAIDQISTATLIFPFLRNIWPFANGHVAVAKANEELRFEFQRLVSEGVCDDSFAARFSENVRQCNLDDEYVEDNVVMLCFVMNRALKLVFQNVAHFLGAEMEWQNRLRQAIVEHDRAERFVRATVKETLRLAPMIPLLTRRALCELNIDGFAVNRDEIILITPYLTHFRPESFAKPEKFDPSRFFNNQNYSNQFIPYGGGKNHCIGSGWSVEVICKLIHALLPIIEFDAPPNHSDFQSFSMRSLFLKRRNTQFKVRLI